MQRLLIAAGVILILLGLVWTWLIRMGLGRLPGDMHFERDGFSFHFPLVSSLVVSIVLSLVVTLIVWLVRR